MRPNAGITILPILLVLLLVLLGDYVILTTRTCHNFQLQKRSLSTRESGWCSWGYLFLFLYPFHSMGQEWCAWSCWRMGEEDGSDIKMVLDRVIKMMTIGFFFSSFIRCNTYCKVSVIIVLSSLKEQQWPRLQSKIPWRGESCAARHASDQLPRKNPPQNSSNLESRLWGVVPPDFYNPDFAQKRNYSLIGIYKMFVG